MNAERTNFFFAATLQRQPHQTSESTQRLSSQDIQTSSGNGQASFKMNVIGLIVLCTYD